MKYDVASASAHFGGRFLHIRKWLPSISSSSGPGASDMPEVKSFYKMVLFKNNVVFVATLFEVKSRDSCGNNEQEGSRKASTCSGKLTEPTK